MKGPHKRLKSAQKELEELMRAPYTSEIRAKQQELIVIIENLLAQEEINWAQRGRVNWLRRGDRNTKYFNHFASARRRRNLIKKLKDNNNGWVEGNDNLNPLISNYFSGLFSSDVTDYDQGLLLLEKKGLNLALAHY